MHNGDDGLTVIDRTEAISRPVPKIAEMMGVSERFAWDLVRSGDLPSFKIGPKVRLVRVSDAQAYIDRLAEQAQAERNAANAA